MTSQNESLFHDQAYGTNETFEPEFGPCDTFNLTTEALSVCKNATNKACMYDYCVTRNDQIAADTLQKDQSFQQDQLIRGNYVNIKGKRYGNKLSPYWLNLMLLGPFVYSKRQMKKKYVSVLGIILGKNE